ncbi:MAG: hypothetical protein EB060_08625, partial [Proteobacteria bacterium]|nr:hypothetical protein [Pseudomonadota bacterium]
MQNDTLKQWTIAAFYRFVVLEDYKKLQKPIADFCRQNGIVGTILLAQEGINSTLAGSAESVKAFFAFLEKDTRFNGIERKYSYSAEQPFKRMKVKLKKEIVRLNVDDLDIENKGEYLDSKMWDKLLSEPGVVVIDTRNDYEVAIGKFKDAIDPKTRNFTDLPQWVDNNLKGKEQAKIAMYCTGGIRCEKSTALLKQKGFNNVFHLKGGILQYL